MTTPRIVPCKGRGDLPEGAALNDRNANRGTNTTRRNEPPDADARRHAHNARRLSCASADADRSVALT